MIMCQGKITTTPTSYCNVTKNNSRLNTRSKSSSHYSKQIHPTTFMETSHSIHLCCSTNRPYHDGLLFSNIIYVVAGFISWSCNQYFCAIFQFGAAIASSMFHRSKERQYLWVDATVSSTLAFVFIYVAHHSMLNKWYGILAIKAIQAILCVFTWIYCGLPGGSRYEKWHQLWHYASGITTISTTIYLSMYMPHFDLILHELVQDYILLTTWLPII